jgi:hypothetical protein
MTPAAVTASASTSPPISGRRRFWFRVAALLLSLFPLMGAELVCRLVGWGKADSTVDPFVGFTAVRPLFQKTADGLEYRTAADRLQYFREDQFAAVKGPGEFRVFVFGGSTVQGHPFSIETSFPTFLRLILETVQPDRVWEVVNCGGVSYASYRLLPIVNECLAYDPDLIVFCSGQNEFLEDVTYGRQRQAAPLLGPVWSVAERLQVFKAAVQVFQGRRESVAAGRTDARPLLPTEVQTLLDQDGGLERYHRDDQHAAKVAEHYGSNVRRLAAMCREHQVPLLVIQPPINLSDCPPFKSEFSAGTSASQRAEILAALKQAIELSASDLPAAVQLAERVVSIDPRFALGWYELGQLLLSAARWDEAAQALQRAVDEDVCPLRMTSPLQRILKETVTVTGTQFLDAQALMSAGCRGGIAGEQRLVDHVHPSFRGHEDLAVAIAEWMQSQGLLQTAQSDWQQRGRERCQMAVQQLDDAYFLQGRRRLQVLKNWAAGRATLPEMAP